MICLYFQNKFPIYIVGSLLMFNYTRNILERTNISITCEKHSFHNLNIPKYADK